MNKKLLLSAFAFLALIKASVWFHDRGPGGSGIVTRASFPGVGEFMVEQSWEGWVDPNGYSVTAWHRAEGEEQWASHGLVVYGDSRWTEASIELSSDGDAVRIAQGENGSWLVPLELGEDDQWYDGFFHDPEWQPDVSPAENEAG